MIYLKLNVYYSQVKQLTKEVEMISSYKFWKKNDLLTLMELYCYYYGIKLDNQKLFGHRLERLDKAIKICKEKIKKIMIADK